MDLIVYGIKAALFLVYVFNWAVVLYMFAKAIARNTARDWNTPIIMTYLLLLATSVGYMVGAS